MAGIFLTSEYYCSARLFITIALKKLLLYGKSNRFHTRILLLSVKIQSMKNFFQFLVGCPLGYRPAL